MGTRIQTFRPNTNDLEAGGTSGALVQFRGNPPGRFAVLTCRHVLIAKGYDVAQADRNRQAGAQTDKTKLHNWHGWALAG